MKRIIAFIVCLLMVLHLAPTTALPVIAEDTTTEYYAEWSIGTIRIYANPNDSVNVLYCVPSQFYSSTFTVKYHGNVNGKDWYYATDVYWSLNDGRYDYQREDYRYIPASSINILGVVQPEITYGEIKAGVGNFSVSIDGAPTDATLSLKQIKEKDYDYEGVWSRKTNDMAQLLGAYDMRIIHNGEEWQPEDAPVTVTMSAASWGLFSGDRVHLIHVHENTDGTKEYNHIGPVYVENGYVSFQTDRFSEYYIFQGSYSQTFSSGPHNLYLEAGGSVTVEVSGGFLQGSGLSSLTKSSGASTITNTTDAIVASNKAQIGDTAVFTASYRGWIGGTTTATITVTIVSRETLIDTRLQDDMMIAILDQSSGEFPSEPTRTANRTYYHVINNNGTYEVKTSDGSPTFTSNANEYLNTTSMANSSAWMTDVNGEQIYGLVDATGRETLDAFEDNQGNQKVDWDQVALRIAEYNRDHNNDIAVMYKQEDPKAESGFNTHTVYLSVNSALTIASYGNASIDGKPVYWGEFKLIPYVIKYQDNKWHVDVAVIRGDSYILGYDINLGEYTLVNSTISLPNAHVYMENPDEDDKVITVTLDAWDDKFANTEFSVVNNEGKEGKIKFKGWWTSPTATTEDEPYLYQPGGKITLSSNETKLYAIWTITEGDLKKVVNTITLYNSIKLQSGSPTGAKVPQYGDADFVKFTFVLDLIYSDRFSKVVFELNRITGIATWDVVTATLADIKASPETYADYIVVGDTNITLYLYGDETIRFSEVPVYKTGSSGETNNFTFTQTITEKTDKYSTLDNGTMSATRTIPAAMSEVTPTPCQVYTYYIPPVVGLHITTENGGENEAYIFTVTYKTDEDAIDPITLIVPAGGEVTVTQCITGNYEIKCVSTWDTLYSTSTTSTTVTLTEGKDSYVTFTYSFNGKKYIYGYSHSTKTVREG